MNYLLNISAYTTLAEAFRSIPVDVINLSLPFQNLGHQNIDELKDAFKLIPPTVSFLNLAFNQLYFLSSVELEGLFRSIPPCVTSLDLTGNELFKKETHEIVQAFSGIPAGIVSLNLSVNTSEYIKNDEFIKILAAIPHGVTILDLRDNNLFFSHNHSAKTIPDLFKIKTLPELEAICAAIPKNVLTMYFNLFEIFEFVVDCSKFNIILSFMKTSVTKIITDDKKEFLVSELLCQQIFPENSRNDFHDVLKLNDPIKPNSEIDMDCLIKLIKYFQAHPAPLHFLICGLLLEGRIENLGNGILANGTAYFETRILLAIDFYRKAVSDPVLSSQVEHLLWEMNFVYADYPHVIEKLYPYRLSPLIPQYNLFAQGTRNDYQVLADNSHDLIDISELETFHALNSISSMQISK